MHISETSFANGVPMIIEQHDILDALEIELRHSLAGNSVAALEATRAILEKPNGK